MVVSKALRDAAGIYIGDVVEVTMQVDTAERTIQVPSDLAALLEQTPKAKERDESSSYTHRKRICSMDHFSQAAGNS